MREFRRPAVSAESQRVLFTFRLVAGVYAALVQLAVWLLAMAAGSSADMLPKVLLPISAAVLLASGWIRPDRNAWLVSLAAVWVPYVVLLWMAPPTSEPWLPLGLFSSIVGIVSAVTPMTVVGGAFIAVFAALQLAQSLNPSEHVRIAASLIHGIPVLLSYQVAVAFGVLFAFRAASRYTHELDARAQFLERLADAESTLEKQRADRLRATQRLHETVLNTLRAVGRQADGAAPELADRCAEDLAVLEDWQYDSRPHTVREVVSASIASVELGSTAVHVAPDRDLTLNAETSEAIRSMLTELLINVSRHAHASNVTVGWNVLDDMRLVFTVEDDGVGIGNKESGRLGIRRIVRDTAASLDGQVLIADRVGGGTAVTLRIWLRAPGIERPTSMFSVNLPRTILKILGQAALTWAVVMSPLVVIDLEQPLLVGASSVIAAASMLLILTLSGQSRGYLFLLPLALQAANLFLANEFSRSCLSASSLQWLLNMFVVGCMVTVVFGGRTVQLISAVAALIVPFALTRVVPPDCSEYVWLPWLSMLTLIPATIAFASSRGSLLPGGVDEQRLDTLLAEQLRRERQADERRLRWAAALDRSHLVMSDIAYSGTVDAQSRQRAEVADAQLRGQLLIEPGEDGALAAFALSLIDAAAEVGVAVKAEVLNVSRKQDPLPEAATAQVLQVLALAQGEAQLKLFVIGEEESMTLVVPIVPGSMPMFADGTVAEGLVEMQYGDLRLEFDPQSVEPSGLLPLWVSVSRPVQ